MICPKCGCRLLWADGAYCQACMSVVDTSIQRGRGEQVPAGGGTTPSTPPCTPPSPCEMCNGVGFYVSLPGDVITPCPGCIDKIENRLCEEDGCCRFCGSDAKGRAVVALRDAVLAELLDHEETKARLVTARGGNIGELVSVLRQAAKDIEAVDWDRFKEGK